MIEGINPDFDMPTILIAGIGFIIIFIYVLISFITHSIERGREIFLKISYKIICMGFLIMMASIFMNVLAGNQFNLIFLKNTILLKSVGRWLFRASLSYGYILFLVGIEIAVLLAFKKTKKTSDEEVSE